MKKKMYFIKLKRKASVGDMIVCIFTVLIMSIIICLTIDAYKEINQAASIKAVEREYMLKLETQGYLTTQDLKTLKEALEKIGVVTTPDSGYSTDGTTIVPANYGHTVKLYVKGKIEVPDKTGITGFFKWMTKGEGRYVDFVIDQQSTSKH